MAIQFYCSGCGQAIEVDNEYANRPIGCPFCHTTITAPPVSQLQPPPSAPPITTAPMAMPAGPAYSAAMRAPTAAAVDPGPVWLCTLSLICAICMFFVPCLWISAFYSQSGIATQMQAIQNQTSNPQAQQQIIKDYAKTWSDEHPGLRAFFGVTLVVLIIAGVSSAIAGLIRAKRRRWQAIVGLIICGLCGMCAGLGIIQMLMARGSGA